MAGVLRYHGTDGHGRPRPGLLLTGARLSVWHDYTMRAVLWAEILAARWTDPDHAELLLMGGDRIPLSDIDRLDEALREIDQRAAAARAAAQRSHRLPDRSRVWFRRQRWLRLLGAAVPGAIAAVFVVGIGFRVMSWGQVCLVGGLITVVGWLLRLVGLLRVTGTGVLVRGGRKPSLHRVRWPEILDVVEVREERHARETSDYVVLLATPAGLAQCATSSYGDVELITEFVRQRREWCDAEFLPAGAKPPPDNAISLARLSGEPGAQRGLSQVRPGHSE